MPFGGFGISEMIFVFAILLLLFGAKRLPELAAGMGKGIRDFKRSLNGLDDESIQQSIQRPAQSAQMPPPAGSEPAQQQPVQQPAQQQAQQPMENVQPQQNPTDG